ncbi:hypothetical protein DKX38_016202 [Salix brachista]|uniref:Uncharacterized protein n=1 Tax=Salix brachista TaxID=2182728 RepID=A0A5N5L7B1_9ROSI|nr:hypothetical protein DKX38_016202 [Salix brachista]
MIVQSRFLSGPSVDCLTWLTNPIIVFCCSNCRTFYFDMVFEFPETVKCTAEGYTSRYANSLARDRQIGRVVR